MADGLPIIKGQDPLGGLRMFFQNLTQGALQRQQQQQAGQQLGQLFPNLDLQGITDPRIQAIAGQLAIAQATRTPQAGFSLSPGQQRFTPSGQPIAQVPVTPQLRAGGLQVSKVGDKTGLPEGTVFQAGPQGKVTIIAKPQTLTIDEQRKRDLIAAGMKPKAISELEKNLTQTVIDKNRAEAEAKLRAGKGILTPEQKISQTNVFRKEFDALSKDFRTIRDSFERMKAATIDPSGAGDIAVIFNFMKILDPGSVVRESEFATAENAAGVPDAIRNLWNKALTGEKIAFNRDDFLKTARNLIKAQQNTQKTLIGRYTKLSNRFGLNPQDVITEVAGEQSAIPTSLQAIPFSPEDIDAELRRRGAIK